MVPDVIHNFGLSWFAIRDLRRLGEVQTELLGAADFCATFLSCHLLLIKVCLVCVCVCVCISECEGE